MYDSALLFAALAAAPWWVPSAILARRARAMSSLEAFSNIPAPAESAPRVSIVLPARNEAAHIVDCVRALQRCNWPNLEVVIVDDHSTDDTGELARRTAGGDSRVCVVMAPALPAGWFGKQWACEVGAAHATGALLLFTDADTRHAPDLVTRLVAARAQRGAELISVAGKQDMFTVWERAVQPLVMALLLLRYGGTRALEGATRASDVIANGQCFLISREGYEAVGRHESVREFVAEDVMLAQAVWRSGRRVSIVLGVNQLRTRMYDGLRALMGGWGKNIYAGGRFTVRGGAAGRVLFPLLLLAFPVALLLPFAALLASAGALPIELRVSLAVTVWGALSSAGVLALLALAHAVNRDPLWRAILAPLGAAVLLVICVIAVARGRRVTWKGRDYRAR